MQFVCFWIAFSRTERQRDRDTMKAEELELERKRTIQCVGIYFVDFQSTAKTELDRSHSDSDDSNTNSGYDIEITAQQSHSLA